jgi:hypothetical protein
MPKDSPSPFFAAETGENRRSHRYSRKGPNVGIVPQAPRNGKACPVLAGFDGFVDTILYVVSERRSATKYSRVATLQAFSEKVLAASGGRNMNIEMVPRLTKIKKLTIERGTAWPTPIWVGLMRLPSPIDTVKVRRAELMPGTEFVRLPGNET